MFTNVSKLFCSCSPVCLNPHCTLHCPPLTCFANNSFPVELPKTRCSGRTVAVPSCVWLIKILVSDMKRSDKFQKRTQTAERLSDWLCGYPILRACIHVFIVVHMWRSFRIHCIPRKASFQWKYDDYVKLCEPQNNWHYCLCLVEMSILGSFFYVLKCCSDFLDFLYW